MLSGLDTLLQAAQFLEQQEQHQQTHRLGSEVTIIPANTQNSQNASISSSTSSGSSVHTNSSSSINTISFIPSNSTSVSESRFLPPIGKISNGTVILTASGIAAPNSSQNGLSGSGVVSSSSSTRILSPISNGIAANGGTTTTAVVAGLVPQGTTAYLTTTTTGGSSNQQQATVATLSSPRHQTGGSVASIVPVLSGSRKRTISNASSHSSGGYVKDEPLVNGHSTAPPLVVISTNGNSSSSSSISSNGSSSHQKHHAASSLTIDLSTKSNSSSSGQHHLHHLSSTPPSSVCSSTLTISPVDDSQSSLNLSSGSSGYITSHSANSSTSLNLSGSNSGSSPLPITITNGSINGSSTVTLSHGSSNSSPLPHDLVIVQQQQQQQHLIQGGSPHGLTTTATLLGQIPTGGRRRTTSSNSNGVGTREVHNKLEKNRRAHLKECFEQLKKQLTLQPDEKKTSNLSILHAAIRHIQLLKRKEREYEHEMERLAKEKIASQNRILFLKRELSQWGDVDFSRLAPDTVAIPNTSQHSSSSTSSSSSVGSTDVNYGGAQSDRDLLNDPPGNAPGRNGIRYSSSSSLSSVATTASIGNLPSQTTISPVLIAASSPSRASPPSSSVVNRNSSSPATTVTMPLPLSLTTKAGSPMVADTHNGTPSPRKFTTTTLPNGFNLSSTSTSSTTNGLSNGNSSNGGSNCSTPNSINGGSIGANGLNGTPLPLIVGASNLSSLSQSQLFTPVTATILTTGGNGGTAIQTLPLNLNVASSVTNGLSNGHHVSSATASALPNGTVVSSTATGLQIIGTTANGTTIPAGLVSSTTGKELINGTTKNGLRAEGNKIEIIATQSAAGSALEPPATKVIKLVNGSTLVGLTSMDKEKLLLSQVVQQGSLVMNPIQLLASQGLRVIQQAPNGGLATIELSTPSNVQPQSSQIQRTTVGNVISSSSSSNPSNPHLSSQPTHHYSTTSSSHQQHPGAQLHKLLITSSTTTGSHSSSPISSAPSPYSNGITTTTPSVTPELARLPGGAELNILPAGTNGATALPLYRTTTGQPGKFTFVNAFPAGNGTTGLTLKGVDSSASGRTAVHVVTPLQANGTTQLSTLTPVVMSRYDQDVIDGPFTTGSSPAHLGKVVKTVGQSPSGLPLIAATPNAQYLHTVLKPTTTVIGSTSNNTIQLAPPSLADAVGSNRINQLSSPSVSSASIIGNGEVSAIAL